MQNHAISHPRTRSVGKFNVIAGVELILEMVRTALNVVDNALVAFLRYFLSRIKLSVFK